MRFIRRLLTWWESQTIGTQLYTWRKGVRVGSDESGNVFYSTPDGKRRWVIYDGQIEASRITPEWHGWLHHTFEHPPTKDPLPRHEWQIGHQENLTGTHAAYVPPGSLHHDLPGQGPGYKAWRPDQKDAEQ